MYNPEQDDLSQIDRDPEYYYYLDTLEFTPKIQLNITLNEQTRPSDIIIFDGEKKYTLIKDSDGNLQTSLITD